MKRPRGRPKSYALDDLAVGESVLLPWRAPGDNDHLRCAVNASARRTGFVFRKQAEGLGLRVTRVAVETVKII